MHIISLEQFRQEQERAIESQDALLKAPRIEISRIVQQQMLSAARNCTGLFRIYIEKSKYKSINMYGWRQLEEEIKDALFNGGYTVTGSKNGDAGLEIHAAIPEALPPTAEETSTEHKAPANAEKKPWWRL
jgi:hypothetical protein